MGQAETRLERRAALRIAVAKSLLYDQVHLAYQPVVALHPKPRRAFAEALARIGNSGDASVPAGLFMPVLEDTALGEKLDCTVLEKALQALKENPHLRLSVNVGARTLESAAWFDTLVASHRTDPMVTYRLIVELTEGTALTDIDRARRFIDRISALGITVALDDFGAGATAFRHLRDLRFDILKIDGTFITGLERSRDNRALLKSLVSLARHFDMVTVAEFAEAAADVAIADEIGIDLFQGYLFGAPAANEPGVGFTDPGDIAPRQATVFTLQ